MEWYTNKGFEKMGVSLFENKFGAVVRTRGGAATRALLRVTGTDDEALHGYDTIFVTKVTMRRGVNSNVAYSLDNHIFLSAAGDRLGTLALQGVVFGYVCGAVDQFKELRAANGKKTGGLDSLLQFYNKNKLVSGRQTMPKLEIVYTDSDGAQKVKQTCYLIDVTASTSDAMNTAMDFTLNCLLVPEEIFGA